MSDFDPYRIFLEELDEANRRRFRITHWRLNRAALLGLATHPLTQHKDPVLPVVDRKFMGIPLQFDGDYASEEPSLRPIYEKYGRCVLVHDYAGPIRHGRDLDRFMGDARQTLADAASNKPSNIAPK